MYVYTYICIHDYINVTSNDILISMALMVLWSQSHIFAQIQCAHGRLGRFLHHRQLGMQHAAVLGTEREWLADGPKQCNVIWKLWESR